MMVMRTDASSAFGGNCLGQLTPTALHSLARPLKRHRRSTMLARFPAAATIVV